MVGVRQWFHQETKENHRDIMRSSEKEEGRVEVLDQWGQIASWFSSLST